MYVQTYGIVDRVTGCVLLEDETWAAIEYANNDGAAIAAFTSQVRARRVARRYLMAQVVACE